MKQILLLSLFLLPLTMHAQFIKGWQEISSDSAYFDIRYGSVKEYNYQHTYWHSNKKNFRMHFVNSRAYYLTEIADWLAQENKCGTKVWIDDDSNDYFECGNDGCPGSQLGNTKRVPFKIKARVNENSRVKSVTITGDAQTLVHLFLFYWEVPDLKIDKLKKGCTIYQDDMDDRITFSWQGTNPVITITQNPNLAYFANNIPVNN